ncbi:hypothetical protein TNCV_3380011 [Trichonephila clavipes]|nr:hypothetical protein TNCV_3380011 [Trichonephila clavipes]
MVVPFEVAHSTACLGPVRKALFLIRVLDSWSASRIKTLGFSSPLPKTTSPCLFELFFFFSLVLLFLLVYPFFQPFKTSGAVHFSPLTSSHWWAHMSRSFNLNSLEPIGP